MSCSKDKIVKAWDGESGKQVREALVGHDVLPSLRMLGSLCGDKCGCELRRNQATRCWGFGILRKGIVNVWWMYDDSMISISVICI